MVMVLKTLTCRQDRVDECVIVAGIVRIMREETVSLSPGEAETACI